MNKPRVRVDWLPPTTSNYLGVVITVNGKAHRGYVSAFEGLAMGMRVSPEKAVADFIAQQVKKEAKPSDH